jgi:hypothetical protein
MKKYDKKSSASLSSNSDFPPALTDDECSILKEFDECFKCRRLFQTHGSRQCTALFPRQEGYCAVARPSQIQIDSWNKTKESSSDKQSYSNPSSSNHPVKHQKKDAAASVILNDDSDSDGSNTLAALGDYEATEGNDVHGKHLYWECCLSGPNSEFPMKTTALLDSGAHVVLICDTLVDELGLRHLPLKDTLSIRGAMSSSRSVLKDYVVLSLSSADLYYTARNVKALVVQELSSPIILGMPFLTGNAITINHRDRLVTDCDQQYNLLGPNDLTPKRLPKQKHVPIEHVKQENQIEKSKMNTTMKYRRKLLEEL